MKNPISYDARVPDILLSSDLPDWCKMIWIAIRSVQGADRSCDIDGANVAARVGKSRNRFYKAKAILLDAGFLHESADGLRCTAPFDGGRYDVLTGDVYPLECAQEAHECAQEEHTCAPEAHHRGKVCASQAQKCAQEAHSPHTPLIRNKPTNQQEEDVAREVASPENAQGSPPATSSLPFDPAAFAAMCAAPDLSFMSERDRSEHGDHVRRTLGLVAKSCQAGWGFPFEDLMRATYGLRGPAVPPSQFGDLLAFAARHGHLQLVAACAIASRVGVPVHRIDAIREQWTKPQADDARTSTGAYGNGTFGQGTYGRGRDGYSRSSTREEWGEGWGHIPPQRSIDWEPEWLEEERRKRDAEHARFVASLRSRQVAN